MKVLNFNNTMKFKNLLFNLIFFYMKILYHNIIQQKLDYDPTKIRLLVDKTAWVVNKLCLVITTLEVRDIVFNANPGLF
jgi:hypothetical protein